MPEHKLASSQIRWSFSRNGVLKEGISLLDKRESQLRFQTIVRYNINSWTILVHLYTVIEHEFVGCDISMQISGHITCIHRYMYQHFKQLRVMFLTHG